MTTVLTWTLDAKTVLAFLAAVFASLTVLFQTYSLNKKLRAEARLQKILLDQWKALMLQRLQTEQKNKSFQLMNMWMDPDSLLEARSEIETALKQLPESDQQAILEGLRQPSEKGRGDYIKKLLAKVLTEHRTRLSLN